MVSCWKRFTATFCVKPRPAVLELNDLSFFDSDSAAVLCRMKREQGVSLEGLSLFIKKVVELADEAEG